MKISDAFPSKWLKADDLPPNIDIVLTIIKCDMVNVGQEDNPEVKPVIWFHGKEKGMVLNVTNANAIGRIHGDDTDDWINKDIAIFRSQTDFRGSSVPCIRVKLDAPAAAAPTTKKKKVQKHQPVAEEDIPF